MRWRRGRRSDNVDDRRARRASRGVRVGGLGGLGLLIVVVLTVLLGGDPMELLQDMPASKGQPSAGGPQATAQGRAEDELAEFVSVVLADTEDTWHAIFSQNGRQYREPVLVLFTDRVQSACGFGSAASGPFYCPADHKVYIDLGFFAELTSRFQAPGDFAQAYVLAHEVGHHVQNLLGISAEVSARRKRVSKTQANELSVRLELQADCLAGVWAHHAKRTRNVLEPGDLEEAINAAGAVGDDRIQRRSQGYIVPDSFTHGTSKQRIEWFTRGFQSGDVDACETF